MNVNSTIASVGMALLLVVSVFPPGMVGTADAQSAPNDYAIIQGDECWEVTPYEPGDPNPEYSEEPIKPHVEIVTESEEFGTYRNSSWDGSPTIESVMDYRYRDPEGNVSDNDQDWGQIPHYAPWLSEPYWKDPWSYGTYGLYNWSENQESHMFFYSGPEGDSVVMRHDKHHDSLSIGSHGPYSGAQTDREGIMSTEQPGRSAVSFTFTNLPSGEWAYIDDMYPEDMDDIYYDSADFVYGADQHTRYGHRDNDYGAEPLESYEGDGNFTIHWTWGEHRTDGGAYRGLENLDRGEEMTIEPRFDEESYFWYYYPWNYDREEGDGITDWVVRRKGEENIHLDKTQEVTIRRGAQCTSADFDFETNSGSASVEAGEEFDLSAQTTGSDVRYDWDLDGDGQFEIESETNATVSHAYDESAAGDVSVTLRIEDGDGVRDSVTKEVRVEPQEPPESNVIVSGTNENSHPEYHVVGETLTFDATNTTDNVALNESSAVWRVDGDEIESEQMQYARAFEETGEHEVSFTVSDEVGQETTETVTIRVDEPDADSPDARAEVTPGEVEAGAPLTFDASASDDDRDIAEYRWDFTDDGEFRTAENETAEFSPYDSEGTYNAILEVEDANGNVDNETVPVSVFAPQDPNVTAMEIPGEVTADRSFELRADAEDESGIDRYEWYVGGDDEPDAFGREVSYTYEADLDAAQEVQVSLAVYDAAGNRNVTDPVTVLVQPPDETAPTANLTVSTSETKVGEDVTFDANGSNDNDEIAEYRWDFDGDGGEPDAVTEVPTTSFGYDEAGTFDATVTVVDESNNSDDATVQVDVEAEEKAIGGGGSGGSSGGGSSSLGPPPVMTQVEERGPNEAIVDVQNARSDETVSTSLPESEVAAESGVQFRHLEVDLDSDDAHVLFETAASADAPESVSGATSADVTMAYLDLGAAYLDGGVESATVEFAVEKSAMPELTNGNDVAVYHYDGAWERLDTEVVEETDDDYRLTATTDSLGTVAVGTTSSVSATDASLVETAVVEGDAVEATATVENAGTEPRTVAVNLIFEDDVAATETVEVPAGETADVTLSADAGDPGTYEVAVGDASAGDLTVEAGATGPADVDVTDVELSESSIDAGEEIEITAVVENEGGETGTYDVTLTLFGEDLRTKTVEVPGGETRDVTFDQRIDAGGTYTVEVNGETAQLEVSGEEGRDDDLPTPGVPGFGVGTALVALLAAALLARFRG